MTETPSKTFETLSHGDVECELSRAGVWVHTDDGMEFIAATRLARMAEE
jgi:hypothetical protein